MKTIVRNSLKLAGCLGLCGGVLFLVFCVPQGVPLSPAENVKVYIDGKLDLRIQVFEDAHRYVIYGHGTYMVDKQKDYAAGGGPFQRLAWGSLYDAGGWVHLGGEKLEVKPHIVHTANAISFTIENNERVTTERVTLVFNNH